MFDGCCHNVQPTRLSSEHDQEKLSSATDDFPMFGAPPLGISHRDKGVDVTQESQCDCIFNPRLQKLTFSLAPKSASLNFPTVK